MTAQYIALCCVLSCQGKVKCCFNKLTGITAAGTSIADSTILYHNENITGYANNPFMDSHSKLKIFRQETHSPLRFVSKSRI